MQYELPISLDVSCRQQKKYIDAKQGDQKTRYLRITLINGTTQLAPASGDVAVFRCLKPDGKSCLNNGVINNDNTISVELTDQVLAVKGLVEADISIRNGEKVLSSATFFIQVEKAPLSADQTTSSNEFGVLTEATADAESATSAANTAAQNATAAANSANSAASSATTAAQNANTAKQKAETATQNANSATTSAINASQSANSAAESANSAASSATSAAQSATTAASSANSAASSATTATQNANTATENANAATQSANTAAAAATAAASAVGEEIDGIVFKDTDNDTDYLCKFRVMNGKPCIIYNTI